ncbi:hypothetical protein HJC23_013784 [Cyclotella cryptica]|uniref:Uncharacterized protein n=1 Tax=Cyclotella cryptica TaxID=29204 RepID=A0ABD3PFI9_9STRA|eukprot:CCRYP_014951-RA/>CCRYP_014951-RA protein AED:0.00 eAED:0.00 QI:162/-1/1/1/-1/1/1/847/718
MNLDPALPPSRHHDRSIPAHLLWRSVLGSAASWSGSGKSSRGIVLLDSTTDPTGGSAGLIRHVSSDKRMFRLPCSLRDRMDFAYNPRCDGSRDDTERDGNMDKRTFRKFHCRKRNKNSNAMQLLPHPRIVHAVPPSSSQTAFSKSNGIACMDLDRGHDESHQSSPSRYLLVGSGGQDCSIALYDLSYFGSDDCLYQRQSSITPSSLSSSASATRGKEVSFVTHRPIARSIRHHQSSSIENTLSVGAVPSGHRYPLLGVHWYPADHGSFVSSSISGEIIVWDVASFTPVFATTAHVYSSGSSSCSALTDGRKSVASLQCVDLPRSPEACPHGRALLALGLGGGGDGRSVIRLCDAFGGGSATHELVGHGGGGVNVVVWDPDHPFRLASGGEDGTVRLWDVRKGGSRACLGVLDRNCGYFDTGIANAPQQPPSSKRQRISLNHGRTMEGVESHAGPVTALAFASGGNTLVSSGLDGTLQLWDLRPDSCYVSSIAATVGKTKSGVDRGEMDPAVACGGRLYPFTFGTESKSRFQTQTKQKSRRNRAASLAIVQGGSRNTAMVFSTSNFTNIHSKGQIAGYSLFGTHGREPGGQPDIILNGHLDDVTCLTPILGAWDNLGVGCHKDMSNVRLLSAGKDGIILSWGVPPKSNNPFEESHPHDHDHIGSRSNIVSMLQQQRQHRLERLNRQYRNGLISGREWHEISNEENGHSIIDDPVDVDTW